jgi:hypothetical protein
LVRWFSLRLMVIKVLVRWLLLVFKVTRKGMTSWKSFNCLLAIHSVRYRIPKLILTCCIFGAIITQI